MSVEKTRKEHLKSWQQGKKKAISLFTSVYTCPLYTILCMLIYIQQEIRTIWFPFRAYAAWCDRTPVNPLLKTHKGAVLSSHQRNLKLLYIKNSSSDFSKIE